MAKRKVFKTVFEIAKEEGELKGKLEGEQKGLRKAIFYILKTTSLTDAQIAVELETDEAFVKTVRQEFIASKQQG
jgi:predicted transposase YdaD